MSFNVSYTFVATDAFSRIARRINTSVNTAKRGFRGLSEQVRKTSQRFQRSSRSIRSNTDSISAGFRRLFIGGGVLLGFRKLITVGGQFQESLLDLSAITGATGADLDQLRDKTFELAKATSTSQAEILTAFKLVGSAKPDLLRNLPALIATTEQVLLLKNAAGIELSAAANITAQSLNIFGQAADQANTFVNILAAGAKLGASEIGDTGAAVLIAGPAARAAGLDFLQLNAAIQATALGGIKGAQAGTALNAILGRLRRAGLDIGAIGLPDALMQVKAALDATTDSTLKAQMEAEIFGEEHAKVGLSLINNIDALRDLQTSLRGTQVAEEQAGLRLSSFNAKMRRLGATINEFLIRAFMRLEPVILEMTDKIGAFFDGLTEEDINRFVAIVGGAIRLVVATVEVVIANVKELFENLNLDMSAFDSVNIDKMVGSLVRLIETLDILTAPGRFAASILKGIGTGIGEGAAMIRTLNFRQGTSFTEAFSVGNRFLGVGLESNPTAPNTVNTNNARADVNVNLAAPPGTIESTSTQVTGDATAMNLGLNLVTQ